MITGKTTVDLSVVIIEDNSHYRRSLETLFNHAKGFRCIASYGSAQAALDEVEKRLRYGQEDLMENDPDGHRPAGNERH